MKRITMEVSHLPQLVKVQKESLKETVEFEHSYTPHNRVETVQVIPKLKFSKSAPQVCYAD